MPAHSGLRAVQALGHVSVRPLPGAAAVTRLYAVLQACERVSRGSKAHTALNALRERLLCTQSWSSARSYRNAQRVPHRGASDA